MQTVPSMLHAPPYASHLKGTSMRSAAPRLLPEAQRALHRWHRGGSAQAAQSVRRSAVAQVHTSVTIACNGAFMQTHESVALALADVTNAARPLCHCCRAHIAQQLQDAMAVRTLQELHEGVQAARVR